MKDVLSISVFAFAVFGLTVFVSVVKPSSTDVVQTATKSVDCLMERYGRRGCGLNALAAASAADVGPCSDYPNAVHR
jgi:hypothetical protein